MAAGNSETAAKASSATIALDAVTETAVPVRAVTVLAAVPPVVLPSAASLPTAALLTSALAVVLMDVAHVESVFHVQVNVVDTDFVRVGALVRKRIIRRKKSLLPLPLSDPFASVEDLCCHTKRTTEFHVIEVSNGRSCTVFHM